MYSSSSHYYYFRAMWVSFTNNYYLRLVSVSFTHDYYLGAVWVSSTHYYVLGSISCWKYLSWVSYNQKWVPEKYYQRCTFNFLFNIFLNLFIVFSKNCACGFFGWNYFCKSISGGVRPHPSHPPSVRLCCNYTARIGHFGSKFIMKRPESVDWCHSP